VIVPLLSVGFKFGFDIGVLQAIGAALLSLFVGNGFYDNTYQPYREIVIKSSDKA
jgi:hypothetical protein